MGCAAGSLGGRVGQLAWKTRPIYVSREHVGKGTKGCTRSVRMSGTTSESFTPTSDLNRVKVISLDITGTLLTFSHPVAETYAAAAVWAGLENPPSASELKVAFKVGYKRALERDPCFGAASGRGSRAWWRMCISEVLRACGREDYAEGDVDRYFRRVYQTFGAPSAYAVLDDALPFLDWALDRGYGLGVTTNTPARTIDTVLPMMGLHDYFQWFASSGEFGAEKPDAVIYAAALSQARFWAAEGACLEPANILHVGDHLAADLCGARAFGMQSLLLDRSANPLVENYSDWILAPDYPGKSHADIHASTVRSLADVRARLERAGSLLPS